MIINCYKLKNSEVAFDAKFDDENDMILSLIKYSPVKAYVNKLKNISEVNGDIIASIREALASGVTIQVKNPWVDGMFEKSYQFFANDAQIIEAIKNYLES